MPKTFRGLLEPDGTNLRWIIVRVPFDPSEAWPERVGLRVKGTIRAARKPARNSAQTGEPFHFRTSLFGTSEGDHILLVNRQMQKGAGIAKGSLAEIVLEPDLEERSATAPPELAKLLKADRALKKYYEQLSYSMRKDIAATIHEPNSADARIRRAEQFAERMMLAMEGEQQTPPILQVAFRSNPQARLGWEAMTPIQRRNHLFGIFGYQSAESRTKRAEKAITEALRIAKKTTPLPKSQLP